MSRTLFHDIVEALQVYDPYFKCKKDYTGMVGFSSLQKCTVAMRLLTYGALGDTADDYLHMAESSALDCLYKFCKAVVVVFGPTYLKSRNAQDIARILAIYEAKGFPGMLGSIDCMHCSWNNCPFAWQGIYTGRHGYYSVVLEVVVDYDL
jgi:hypothetical protein